MVRWPQIISPATDPCKDLEGHIIDCGHPNHVDVYNTMMEELVNYAYTYLISARQVSQKDRIILLRSMVTGDTEVASETWQQG